MFWHLDIAGLLAISFSSLTSALRYDVDQVGWNLNENETATEPTDYWGEWSGHDYTPSPSNWRFPFYALSLDRYANGDPENDDANGTVFEHDWMSNQFRFGGDLDGLTDNLDYIQGLGIKALYLTGSPFINMPWSGDGYGPLDLTLLDHHHGNIANWRAMVDDIHSRGMYIILDHTMATMGDLIGFEGYLNTTAPFSWDEHDYLWKYERRYHDFQPGNTENASCTYPRMWGDDGYQLSNMTDTYGCRVSEFDQYGDLPSEGSYPAWRNSLSKFDSVQDRLREWNPAVLDKIKVMTCLQISMLDIDGFRMDKGVETTVDAMAEFTSYQRECAKNYGKDNFFIVGEIVGEAAFGAVYVGRGTEPPDYFTNSTEAMMATNDSGTNYIRDFGATALDGSAFHYPAYGALSRFLGIDGAIGSDGVNFSSIWETILSSDDMVNANTGSFDPRHMFGLTNQDIFRWPSLSNGTQRQMLGSFITTLGLPGVPLMLWGEEQGFYILDNTANNYVYGRSPMASSRAWQIHGCNTLGEPGYYDMPFNSSKYGCYDDSVSLDHKDPSKQTRNIYKRFYELRRQYPVLNDGWILKWLSNNTADIYLPGSNGIASPTGIWSMYRGRQQNLQNFTESQSNQGVWMVYHNQDETVDYTFDCSFESLISPFDANTTVKNLFWPYEEETLETSTQKFYIEGSTEFNGCLPKMTLKPWGYKAYVPVDKWVEPRPVITSVSPGHDERIASTVGINDTESVMIEIQFSSPMDCDSVSNSLNITSSTINSQIATINASSVDCASIDSEPPTLVGGVPGAWRYRAQLLNVANGLHTYTISNVTNQAQNSTTNTNDKFMFRIGQTDNPLVFPSTANYSSTLLNKDSDSNLYIAGKAAGADLFRYSTNWGSSYSNWTVYTGENVTITPQDWSGTDLQKWTGEHVIVQYWSKIAGSADHIQHGDLDRGSLPARRWPHAFVEGGWNQYGYDNGLSNSMRLDSSDGFWKFDLVAEWPAQTMINIWGMNPDGSPDKSMSYGDLDGDGVLDWMHPDSLATNVINITSFPPMPHLGYTIVIDDGTYNYQLKGVGSVWHQLVIAVLMAIVPVLFAAAAVWVFMRSFYKVKFNEIGITEKGGLTMAQFKSNASGIFGNKGDASEVATGAGILADAVAADAGANRRTVLIATMEYEIPDWAIKIKIGGLGVMSSLMGTNLGHQNLIWVVPCVGDVEYPIDQRGEVMNVTILGKIYEVEVQYHVVRNITYVLLDAPVFRKQTKAEPYPARMDDLDSAIYYSAWNSCIAKAIERFPVDLLHINDYHGALAPLHLLPKTIPICLSLHNAEFQGLWPLRTPQEMKEICGVFDLSEEVVRKYVQFGEVFNLLHAGASYLCVHQKGFGAVGVSKKYGKRSFARYPIFWGLSKIGALPNPDPSDIDVWDKKLPNQDDIRVDATIEAGRGNLRAQAQQWAGLQVDPSAELFVFVGRWSMQKGIDLIADVFFSVLEENPKAQLIAVGPVIDLYGKFAALKLSKLMAKYPTRVFSKPEFTALPPYLFSGAEFSLIPSRDEPFGLVAVEFGRKGALGVGSRVGGLGQMPGWWFTVESTTTKHLMGQFKSAIRSALASSTETRAMMRARSALQRFPVAQWVEDLEILQTKSIQIHHKRATKIESIFNRSDINGVSTVLTYPPEAVVPHIKTANPELEDSLHGSNDSGHQTIDSPYTSGLHVIRHQSSRLTAEGDRSQASTATNSRRNSSIYKDSVYTASIVDNEHENGFGRPPQYVSDTRLPTVPPGYSLNSPSPSVLPNVPLATKSQLSLMTVVGEEKDFKLQQVDPFFTDANSAAFNRFEEMLDNVNGKTSENQYCIETYLIKSERKWFNQRHNAKLGREYDPKESKENYDHSEFMLGENYTPPSGLMKLLAYKIGDWQLYTFLLALGQILAANSYQITLIAGENGQTAGQLYAIASVYLVASAFWWLIFCNLKSIYVLSTPFIFYGVAFFLLGMAPHTSSSTGEEWIRYVASAMYAIASASGSIFFALNFGDEGGAPVEFWVFRACVIQGTQQLYIAFLWYWGATITTYTTSGSTKKLFTQTSAVTAVTTPIAILLWVIGIILFLGLPKYYRQNPGKVPSFYTAMLRRKIVLWFFVMVVLQNYWLASTYGRNWRYLWSSSHAPAWAIVLLVLFFFVIVWSGVLWSLALLTKRHSWVIPIFAIGLGAPRWCQMLWGTSNIGQYVPWGGPVAGAILGRSLWCWLGVLDAVQGVGFGMILLQTLTRLHIAASLIAAQMIGSAVTMIARATAPNNIGPGGVFPDFGTGWGGLVKAWFWVALACQAFICIGFFTFFRKEQLSKP